MRNVTKSEGLKVELFLLCPEFANWDKEEWALFTHDDGSFSVHQVFSAFSSYIIGKLEAGKTDEIVNVFQFVEAKLGSDEEIKIAACTCFLENIMNRVPESINPKTFVHLLGPESRKFCKEWDEWCGIETEGL